MEKINIILITTSFPYLPGEQFLETEVQYYSDFNDVTLKIVPLNISDNLNIIDENIIVDNYFRTKKKSFFKYLKYTFKSATTLLFYKEFFSINKITFSTVKSFLFSISSYQMYYEYFEEYLSNQKNLQNTVIYTYWHNEASYALQTLKIKYEYKLISRIHGYDIYQERRAENYMPLKRNFIKNIDKLYTITENANSYLTQTYNFSSEQISLSRLGVKNLNIKSNTTDINKFHILSCAFVTSIKQLDKIVDALACLTNINPKIEYHWTHIGDGVLLEKLKNYTNQKLKNLENCKYTFLGNLTNQDIYQFYKNNPIDVFINTSKSEGVPVSIMEAMSCHIPIVAPNIGGISDMIDDHKNGFLLSKDCNLNEIIDALQDISFFKQEKVRQKSYEIFLTKYNASINYTSFIYDILNTSKK